MTELAHPRQARRAFVTRIVGGAFALLLAGCQVIPGGGPPRRGPEPPPVAQPTPTPTPRPRPGLPQDADRNRVAVLAPLSGGNAGVGQSIANAAQLALMDTGGKDIRITVYDTAKGGAAAAANEALADGNRLFLGPLLAEDVRAVAPVARAADVPVLAFSNDVSVASEGVYLLGFDPRQSIARVVGHARSQNIQRFAGIAPDGDYGRRAGQALLQEVERQGGRMVGLQSYSVGTPSLRSAVTQLAALGEYDAVLIADAGRAAAIAAPLLRADSQPRLLGTELWKTDSNLGTTAALRGAWYAGVSDTRFLQLRDRYRQRYGRSPYRLASLGYDGVLLAIRVSRDWRPGQPFPDRALRAAEGFEGIDGAFRFGRDNVAERALEVVEVTASGNRVVSPAPSGF